MKARVRIASLDYGVEVEGQGFARGNLILHPAIYYDRKPHSEIGETLSHVGSGLAIAQNLIPAHARVVVPLIAKLTDWSRTQEDLWRDVELGEQVGALLRDVPWEDQP